MDGKSLNIAEEKLKQLKAFLPEAFTEGKVDWEKLRLTLGEDIDISDERYMLNWAGKRDAFKTLQTPTTATLGPAREESVNFNNTENIFIEGENLEALKVLQKAYYGKVKMIYIDPPYNTGNDSFVYPDSFAESREEYLKRVNDKDEEGLLLREELFRKNSKDNGHYHSNWLSMMYPRLFLAKNLLSPDGVLFVSIDNNEIHNLEVVLNELFGEENFVATIVWKKKTGSGSQIEKVFSEHEYVLVYTKDSSIENRWRIRTEGDGNFNNPDNDPRGPWESCAITAPSKNRNPNQFYMIEVYFDQDIEITDNSPNRLLDHFTFGKHTIVFRKVDKDAKFEAYFSEEKGYGRFVRRWSYIPKSMREVFDQGKVYLKNGNLPRFKKFEKDYEGKALRSIYFSEFSTQQGSSELSSLLGESLVEYPKPVGLIKTFISATTNENDIILDFFAGSATLAQSVLEANIEDNGNRKFICVQLAETTEEKGEAFIAGYKTIAEIAKERIRRVIVKIKKENPMIAENGQDLGFKVFKLKHSNFKLWRGDGIKNQGELEKQLDMLADPVRPEAIEEHMLFELLLKSGYPLTTQVEKREVGKAHYYQVDGGLAIALTHLDEGTIKDILELKPQQVICLDSLFADNDPLKTNTQLQLKDAGITFHSI